LGGALIVSSSRLPLLPYIFELRGVSSKRLERQSLLRKNSMVLAFRFAKSL